MALHSLCCCLLPLRPAIHSLSPPSADILATGHGSSPRMGKRLPRSQGVNLPVLRPTTHGLSTGVPTSWPLTVGLTICTDTGPAGMLLGTPSNCSLGCTIGSANTDDLDTTPVSTLSTPQKEACKQQILGSQAGPPGPCQTTMGAETQEGGSALADSEEPHWTPGSEPKRASIEVEDTAEFPQTNKIHVSAQLQSNQCSSWRDVEGLE